MSNPTEDAGIIQTLLDRLNTQRLPLALALKEKVDRGETLSEYDIGKLEEILTDAQALQPLIERHLESHPEHQDFIARIEHLYAEIVAKALENQKLA
jgi:hypothetical protein